MKMIMIILLFISESYMYGQLFTIKGNVRDKEGMPIPYATIQISDTVSKQPVSFAFSDLSGSYKLIVSKYGNFEIEVNSLGYLNDKYRVHLSKETEQLVSVNFNLEINPVQLNEIIVRPKEYGRISKDTINYYISQYTDGSERILKDILNKLPGIDIKDNGVITANGKDVEKLLIEGEDFFFNQPKMAIENLSASMVSNVQLLDNYFSNPLQKEFNQDGQTVLNIRLKNEFKGKPSGDLFLGGGIIDKYNIHSNAYIFSKKIKAGVIEDINNTGTNAYSLESLNIAGRGIEQLAQNDISKGSITQFNSAREIIGMNLGNNARSKKSGLLGFNMNYIPNQKTKINTNFILNRNIRNEYENLRRIYLLNDVKGMTDTENQKKLSFGSMYFDVNRKWSENTRLSYRASVGYNKANEYNQINDINLMDSTFFLENKISKQWYLNQFINLTSRKNEKSLISLSFFQEMNQTVSSFDLYSDSVYLGLPFEPLQYYKVYQNYNNRKNLMGSEFSYTCKFGKTLLRNIIGFNMNTCPLSSQLNANSDNELMSQELKEFGNNVAYRNNDLRLEIYWIKNMGTFQFKIGPALHYYRSTFNDNNVSSRFAVLPNVLLLLKFREGHDLMAGYQMRNMLPGATDLKENFIINNFRTISGGGLNLYDYSVNQTFSLQYVFFDVYSGTVLSSSLRYSNNIRPVITSVTTKTNYNIVNSASGTSTDSYNCQMALDKRLGFIPAGFGFQGLFNKVTIDNYFNGINSKVNSVNWQIRLGLSTRFSNPVNAELGIEYRYNKYELAKTNTVQKFDIYRPYLKINTSFKSGIRANASFSQANYATTAVKKLSWIADFDFSFVPQKRKTEFFINGSNLLNIKKYEWLDTQYEQNYFEEREYRMIPGYILLGLKYNF